MNEIMLTIIMSNYNQEKYIRKAIDSVLMQKVNFKYKLIITDDFSHDDGSIQIIKEYAEKYQDIIYPIYNKENGRYLKNILRAKSITRTPYFCLLDADDFYTDSEFLQRAFNFLQNNREYVIYYENVKCLNEDGSEKYFLSTEANSGTYDISDYFNDRLPIVQTTGQFYRNVIFSKGIPQIMEEAVGTDSERSFEGDYDRFIMHLKYGKAYFNNQICGVYRVLSSGIWNNLSNCSKSLIQLQCYYDYNRYFENRYSEFFTNKMYNEFQRIMKNFTDLNALDFSEHQLIQLYTLYSYLIEKKNEIVINQEKAKTSVIIKKKITNQIKKIIYRCTVRHDKEKVK